MAGSLNRAQLIGHLGADPDVRRAQDGRPIVSMRVATSERWKDRDGNQKEKTEWHSVVVFAEHAARFAEQYLKKGALVFLVQNFGGTLTSLDKAPSTRPPASSGPADYGRDDDRSYGRSSTQQSSPSFSHDMDDDIPF